MDLNKIYLGDNIETMKTWPDAFVHTCVTSPPYFGLRDYGMEGQLGQEATPEGFIAKLVDVFREVKRVLRDDGTLWLNLGDSYNAAGRTGHGTRTGFKQATNRASAADKDTCRPSADNLKPKDLIGIPWRVAFALQADGWYLRSDIIWAKKNCMPESVTDRPSKSHEYIFLLSKQEKYYYDSDAIKEPATESSLARVEQNDGNPKWNGNFDRGNPQGEQTMDMKKMVRPDGMRNKRSVWNVATNPFREAHFATFPPDLIKPCILAGAPAGGTVLDPFMGAGTTALVAAQYGRSFIGCELNPEYKAIADRRVKNEVAQEKLF